MSDLAAVVLALCTAAGAWAARPFPLWAAVLVVALAFAVRRPVLLWLGCAVLASSLSATAWAGLRPPAPRHVAGVVTLLRDPADVGGATRAVARLGSRHVELTARGAAGRVLSERLAGERVRIDGRLGPVAPRVAGLLARQHVAGEVTTTDVTAAGAGTVPSRLANGVRRLLVRGAWSLPPDRRALFTGFVLGDDRGQSPETVDDFRASGLSHLLVVSGENVAFALALAGPLLRRLQLRGRLIAGIAVLIGFGVLTRWEPSVLRAEAMAAISLGAAAVGRPVSTVRVLALAVTALLLADPMLVGSVGFLLSVSACLGIAVLAPRLTPMIPGPRSLASAAAVTLAAQAGVAPVLIPVFGAVPVATLPANLLAVPAAGPVMIWGVTAGLPAGLLGGRAAGVLHLPTRLLVWWIAVVAHAAARAPLGRLGAVPLVLIAVAEVVAAFVRRWRIPAVTAIVVVALWPAAILAVHAQPLLEARTIAPGAQVWREGAAAVLVIDRPSPGPLLQGLHRAGVSRLDLVVVRVSGARAAAAVAPLPRQLAIGAVLAPVPLAAFPGAIVVDRRGVSARAGPFIVTAAAAALGDASGKGLVVHVERSPP